MSPEQNIFLKLFEDKKRSCKKRLYDYIQNPNKENIHNLRTSIRRLESLYLIIPKSYKTKKTEKFISSYKSVFKKNSIVRDLDIIYDKLLNTGIREDSEIISLIINQRKKKLKTALKYADKLSGLKDSTIKNPPQEKIKKKYEKIVYSLIDKIQNFIPVVVSDESRIDELHSMRKTAKKLRYVLETDTNDSYLHVIDNMKTFQKLLGEIHDCDVTLDFLKYSKKFPEISSLPEKIQKTRSGIYHQLSNSLRDTK